MFNFSDPAFAPVLEQMAGTFSRLAQNARGVKLTLIGKHENAFQACRPIEDIPGTGSDFEYYNAPKVQVLPVHALMEMVSDEKGTIISYCGDKLLVKETVEEIIQKAAINIL